VGHPEKYLNLEESMLNGKVILITGASRGIGRATALLAAENHAQVIVNYQKSSNKADNLVAEITGKGFSASAICCDVTCEEDVREMFRIIREKYGRLDILVNNAGIMKNNLLLMTKPQEYQDIMDVNCKGTFLCTQYAAKMMIRQKGGKIINLASIMGVYGSKGLTVYSASKSFIIGFTKSAAKELGMFNISVNAVAPGFIDTDLTADTKPQIKDEILHNIALGRIGKPEDVAKVILFLGSELADYISGQVIGVDGCEII
jgi:3-oxoacyl-[acyl-carrier protein] reductase